MKPVAVALLLVRVFGGLHLFSTNTRAKLFCRGRHSVESLILPRARAILEKTLQPSTPAGSEPFRALAVEHPAPMSLSLLRGMAILSRMKRNVQLVNYRSFVRLRESRSKRPLIHADCCVACVGRRSARLWL